MKLVEIYHFVLSTWKLATHVPVVYSRNTSLLFVEIQSRIKSHKKWKLFLTEIWNKTAEKAENHLLQWQ